MKLDLTEFLKINATHAVWKHCDRKFKIHLNNRVIVQRHCETAVGRTLETGQSVQHSVTQVSKPEPEPAPTLPLNTEEQSVRDMLLRHRSATLTLVMVS